MIPPRVGAVTAQLLATPHLIHPGWLRAADLGGESTGTPSAPRGADLGGRSPGAPGAPGAPGVSGAGPEPYPDHHAPAEAPGRREAHRNAGNHAAARDAVPFAAATPIAPAVAGRLAAAVLALGESLVFGCPVAPERSGELVMTIPVAEGAWIHAALQELGAPDALVVLPGLSAALLTTSAGFAVAAGPRRFAEAVAGADLRRARAGFAQFALGAAGSSARPLEAASYYGCALSGRAWRPAWLAWSRAADVPHGSGIGGQLAAMRKFVAGRLGAAEFSRMFRLARRQEMWAGERAVDPLAAALDATCWALDGYVPPGGGWSPAPGQLGIDGLREAVSVALRHVDA